MIYPITLPCPRLATAKSKASRSTTISVFDYGSRSKRIAPEEYLISWSSVYNKSELQEFRDWYETIDYGVDSFDANWGYEGTALSNTFRFIAPYSVKSLGNDNYIIATSVEILGSLNKQCTLQVSETLTCGAVPICQSETIENTNILSEHT